MASMHQWEVDLERQRDAVRDRQRIAELEAEVARLRDHAQDAGACEHCDFVAWRWRWGEKDFWKYTDLNGPGIPSTAYQVEPLYTDGGSSLRTPAACEQPDIDTLAQFIRDAEREHGQCDDDDTYLSYRPTARAILQKFDVRPK